MPSKNHTSVVLSDNLQAVKDRLMPVYGLKNLISAGLLLFSRLSDTDQRKIIEDVNEVSKEPLSVYPDSRIRQMVHEELAAMGLLPDNKKSPVDLQAAVDIVKSVTLKIPSKKEQESLSFLRKVLGPEPRRKKGTG